MMITDYRVYVQDVPLGVVASTPSLKRMLGRMLRKGSRREHG